MVSDTVRWQAARMADEALVSPFDTGVSATLRFVMELTAWIAGPWAVAELFGSGWAAVPALIVLVGLPATFNTPGDKNQTGIPTAGPLRIGIEMALFAVAVAGAWYVWPDWAAIPVTMAAVAAIVTGMPRYRWLAQGAPPVSDTKTPKGV